MTPYVGDVLSVSAREHRSLTRRLTRAIAGDPEEDVPRLLDDVVLHEALERALVYAELDAVDERLGLTLRRIEQDNITWLVEHVARAEQQPGPVLLALQRALTEHFDREELETHPVIWRHSGEESLWRLSVAWQERRDELRRIQLSSTRYLCLEELSALCGAAASRAIDLVEHEAERRREVTR